MTNRERVLACLNYQPYDRLPIIHFGFWWETLAKWRDEGHLTDADVQEWGRTAAIEKMGFDLEWDPAYHCRYNIDPAFEYEVLEEKPDGTKLVRNWSGAVMLQKDDAGSIPAEVDHLLKDRASWEEHYLPRLQFSEARAPVNEAFLTDVHDDLRGLHCGSLFGHIRDWIGVEGTAYMYADDEELFTEIIDTVGNLCYRNVETVLAHGMRFDFAHFWEDICFKNGPLINPAVFDEKVGPHYKRITDLVKQHGIDIISLDCDGCIDKLVPIWLENGVNTMFPIEVGTWDASIAPWRAQYGQELRGVGGMNKTVFAADRAAVDAEIERLKPLIELGGFIPCPDHRIPPDAQFENVVYYTERMRAIYG